MIRSSPFCRENGNATARRRRADRRRASASATAGRADRRSAIDAESPGRADRLRQRRRSWLPPLIWAALILGASSLRDLQTTTGGIEIRDKLAHFGEYLVFGWLLARASDGRGWSGGRHFAWAVLLGLGLGTLDELYQGFVPGRERDVLDLLADVVGTAAGWYLSREDQAIGDSHGASGHT